MFPLSVSNYLHSLEEPDGLLRTLRGVELVRDFYGRPLCTCGANVAVFRIRSDGRNEALRCPLRPSAERGALWRALAEFASPLMPRMEYLPGEIWVWDDTGRGAWCDVQRVEWVEGRSLDACVRDAAHTGDAARLLELAVAFDRMALALLAEPWAHGDLKPENVIVAPDGGCRPVDFDAAWIPGVAGCASEGGTPGYAHPARGASDARADDYPVVLIAASLHALALDPGLYAQYNDSDRLLFAPDELLGGGSAAWDAVMELFVRQGRAALCRLARLLVRRRPAIPEAAGALGEVLRHAFRAPARVVAVPDAGSDEAEPAVAACTERKRPGRTKLKTVPSAATGPGVCVKAATVDCAETGPDVCAAAAGSSGMPSAVPGDASIVSRDASAVPGDASAVPGEPLGAPDPAAVGEPVRAEAGRWTPAAEHGVWGFRDAEGRWMIAPVYDRALAFGEGLAAVELGGYGHYVDCSGEAVLHLPGCDGAGTFRDGAAPVCRAGRWGYLSREGRWIVPPCLMRAGSVRGGRVRIADEAGEREVALVDLSTECNDHK